MSSKTRFATLVLAGLITATCGEGGQDVSLRLFFNLDDATVMQLWLYRDPPEGFCDATLMAQAGPWNPPGTPTEGPVPVSYGENEMELNPGQWGFVFRAGNADHEIGTRDLARGCATERLTSGVNLTPVEIWVVRPFWPGVCGDGNLDPEEMCDDGNTADDDVCSADCQSTPVRGLSTLDTVVTATAAQYQPDVVPMSGGYMLAYTCDSLTDWETSKSVNVQKLDANGGNLMISTWPVLRLNLESTASAQEQPRIAMAATAVVATWLDFEGSRTVEGDVRVRKMDTDTGSGSREVFMYSDNSGTERDAVIAGNGSSTTMIVAWTSDGDVMCRRVLDGVPETAAESSCASSTAGEQNRPAVAMAADGSYAVAWAGAGTVYVRFFSSAGAASGAEVEASTSAGTHSDPALAFDRDGRLLVAWKEGGNVRGRIFSATGTPDAADFIIGSGITTSGDRGVLDVAGGEGRTGPVFLVVWVATGVGVRGRIVSGTDLFEINRLVPPPSPGAFTDTGAFPVTPSAFAGIATVSVASDGSGSALVAWEDNTGGNLDIRGRIIPMN